MADPYIKAIPHPEDGKLHFVVDQAGFEQFERMLAQPRELQSHQGPHRRGIPHRWNPDGLVQQA